jgi:hypothetical protein
MNQEDDQLTPEEIAKLERQGVLLTRQRQHDDMIKLLAGCLGDSNVSVPPGPQGWIEAKNLVAVCWRCLQALHDFEAGQFDP